MSLTKVLLLALTVALVKSDIEFEEEQACKIKALKQVGFLESTFPSPKQPEGCDSIDKFMESEVDYYRQKFNAKDGINIECVIKELKEKNFFHYTLSRDVVLNSKESEDDSKRKIVKNFNEAMQPILNEVSHTCNSDPQWGLYFVDILGLSSATQTVLEQQHCILKFSLDGNYIDIKNINTNPHNIDISNVNCDEIIKKEIQGIERHIKESLKEDWISQDAATCYFNTLKEQKFVEENILLLALRSMDIDPLIRHQHEENMRIIFHKDDAKIASCNTPTI